MKNILTFLTVLTVTFCVAQDNKFGAGDFGIRYGVSFNSVVIQGLTFSGMVTDNWEVGSSINVQFSKSSSTNTYASETETYANNTYTEVPAFTTEQSSGKTLNTSLSPFMFYHFKIKSNLDVYVGPNLIVGTGPHTLSGTSNDITQAPGYYSGQYLKETYPLGYEIGMGVNVGGQYFFYKRLALGVQASVGATYSSTNGNEKSISRITNSGANNNNTENINSTSSGPYTNHALSAATGSSIGITLSFYMAQKAKTKKAGKTL